MRKRRTDWFKVTMVGIVGLVPAMILTFIGLEVAYYQTSETVTFTVTDKETKVTSDGENVSSKYIVFTENETFENTDLLFGGKFNSSDIQGKLKRGETYTADVYGWRVPFFSMYRNIVVIK